MKRTLLILSTLLFICCAPINATAEGVTFDLLKSTPIGSWQVREDINTNAKGKQSGNTIRTSLISQEMRNDEMHYWIEMSINTFKISKKGKRKPKGKTTIMKSLVPASTLKGDPANVMSNLAGFGAETIMQNGNEKPMRMRNSGGMMAGIMQATQTQIKYDFSELGSEKVTVPAGDFSAKMIKGTGTIDVNMVFKKMHIESINTSWMSNKVPFGIVKVDGSSTTNGKPSSFTSQLLEYGMSGAQSQITGEPQDMPDLGGGLNGLFGN